MSKELEAFVRIERSSKRYKGRKEDLDTIFATLKNYEELIKIDCKQNTINDFYPNTKSMIDELFNLMYSKMCDFLKEGETYTKTRILELLGTAVRYVKTFAYGSEFNETEKVGVNTKKLKALEIIKKKPIVALVDYKYTYEEWLSLFDEKGNDLFENKEEYDLLKEILL